MRGTYYELLGIKPTASPEEIKDAYKANIAKYHPDHNKAPNAHQMAVWLNAAYETLRDPDRRTEYDLSIGIANKNDPGQRPKRETRPGDRSQKEAEWRRQKEAEEAERRRKRSEAERQQRDEEAARQRAADEESRKAQEAARREQEAEAKRRQADEEARKQLTEQAARKRRRLIATFALIVGALGVVAFLRLNSVSTSESSRHVVTTPTEVAATEQPVVVPSQEASTAPPVVATISCTPPDADLSNPTPQHFTDEQMRIAEGSYLTPPVLGLRHALNAYVRGSADSDTAQSLKDYSKDLIRQPFFLLYVGDAQMGGNSMLIQFANSPFAVYEVWLYRLSDGSYVIRDWTSSPCTIEQQHWTSVTYGETQKRLLLWFNSTDLRETTVAANVAQPPNPTSTHRVIPASDGDPTNITRLGTGSASSLSSPAQAAQVSCNEATITRVADDGATVDASDGNSYMVSSQGIMRFQAEAWSTGDGVAICHAGSSASIENHAKEVKIQVSYQGPARSTQVSCHDGTITRVGDDGATVDTSDGASYQVSTQGIMRFQAEAWSTGDDVTICRSGASASIENHAKEVKVQAAYQGANPSTHVTCHGATITSVGNDGATIRASDGASYDVSSQGIMRFQVQSWSTGDAVTICRSGASTSIANIAKEVKVQATRI